MSYTIIITDDQSDRPGGQERKVFQQTVEVLDLPAVFNAVNKKKRKPRETKSAKTGVQA